MTVKIDNLERLYEYKDKLYSYFLGDIWEKTGEYRDSRKCRTILFTIPREIEDIIHEHDDINNLSVGDLKKLSRIYINTNLTLNDDIPPFQINWLTIESFQCIKSLEHYPKEWYRILMSNKLENSYEYLKLLEEEWKRSTEKSLEEKS